MEVREVEEKERDFGVPSPPPGLSPGPDSHAPWPCTPSAACDTVRGGWKQGGTLLGLPRAEAFVRAGDGSVCKKVGSSLRDDALQFGYSRDAEVKWHCETCMLALGFRDELIYGKTNGNWVALDERTCWCASGR